MGRGERKISSGGCFAWVERPEQDATRFSGRDAAPVQDSKTRFLRAEAPPPLLLRQPKIQHPRERNLFLSKYFRSDSPAAEANVFAVEIQIACVQPVMAVGSRTLKNQRVRPQARRWSSRKCRWARWIRRSAAVPASPMRPQRRSVPETRNWNDPCKSRQNSLAFCFLQNRFRCKVRFVISYPCETHRPDMA